jgi:hypothetical protein
MIDFISVNRWFFIGIWVGWKSIDKENRIFFLISVNLLEFPANPIKAVKAHR